MKILLTNAQRLTEIKNIIIKHFNHLTSEEYTKETGFILDARQAWGKQGIFVSFKDPFYASITKDTFIDFTEMVTNNKILSSKEVIKHFNSKINYKKRQIIKLSRMKQKAVIKIKDFISTSFSIPYEMIKDSDIKFGYYATFSINEVKFSFDFLLSGEKVEVNTYSHSNYIEVIAKLNSLLTYFYSKDITSITGYSK